MDDQEVEIKDIVVTFDTLFEILRNEKTKEDLQKLHDTFFQDFVNYLKDKQNAFGDQKEQQGLFEGDEREKKLQQIANTKKILRDIYDRREKKILNMAINKSRFASNIIDTSALLDEENLFYEMMVSLLDSQRGKVLDKLLNCEVPSDLKVEIKETSTIDSNEPVKKEGIEVSSEVKKESTEELASTKLVRFLMAVPQFIGEDMLEYGPFEEEDVSKLPFEIADVLIQKERVEEIKEES